MRVFYGAFAIFWGALAGCNGHYMVAESNVGSGAVFGGCVVAALIYLILLVREMA